MSWKELEESLREGVQSPDGDKHVDVMRTWLAASDLELTPVQSLGLRTMVEGDVVLFNHSYPGGEVEVLYVSLYRHFDPEEAIAVSDALGILPLPELLGRLGDYVGGRHGVLG